MLLLTDNPLDVQACIDAARAASCGAMTVFLGLVRNATEGKPVNHLEYEAYQSMALKTMHEIMQTVQERWQGARIAMQHRTGTLAVGDIAVVIAVATPHRQAAFEACKYAIDTLKQRVPIWKKEFFEDGAVWVMPHA
jgi:molybdopterin synthase catalytic subunit